MAWALTNQKRCQVCPTPTPGKWGQQNDGCTGVFFCLYMCKCQFLL